MKSMSAKGESCHEKKVENEITLSKKTKAKTYIIFFNIKIYYKSKIR